ncbi:PDR/VanB family oxidoreductase [Variovorax sp. KK3]|uniref:PDR/VanB family oxidoreductase n=1 Tax=Variovorax sp. KK3 TaxID=1855728 RepID=UPI00097C33C2|nr:PDR/VanB family oxidoreductase [Variovorax sp. KK3]
MQAPSESELLQLRLSAIRWEADGVQSFEFRDVADRALPGFLPGAHVDLHLPNGMSRSYSLCNDCAETDRYVVAVARDAKSRGGSIAMHDTLRVGQLLKVGRPRNHFPLDEEAAKSVLIAGGIGITPMWCMLQRLQALGRDWELFYAARGRQNAAFLRELRALSAQHPGRVHLHFDQEQGLFDLAPVLRALPAGAHVYCCGPLPMLEAFERLTADRPPAQVHLEYFQAKDAPAAAGGVQVELSRSKKVVTVAEGKTVLDAVLDAGIDVPYSCMEGICGSCEVVVLEGEPDHRDSVLSDQQKRSNKTMMLCCSGARSARLVLDL